MKLFSKGTILFPKSGASTFLNHRVIMGVDGYVASHLGTIDTNPEFASNKFVYFMLTKIDAKTLTADQTYPSLRLEDIAKIEIPLPPIEVQEQLVVELDGYTAIISGAKQIIDNWKPNIDVDPDWNICELGEICEFINGDRSDNYPTIRTQDSSGIPFINAGNLSEGKISLAEADFITEDQFKKIGGGKIETGDVLFCLRGSLGKMALNIDITKGAIASSLIILRAKREKVEPLYLYTLLASNIGQNQIAGQRTGAAQPNLAAGNLKKFKIPLPAISIQKEIVASIGAEEFLIESAKRIVVMYETRKELLISKLWNSLEDVV